MVDQKQGTTGKHEKAGKPIVVDQKQDAASNSTGSNTAANAAQATAAAPTKMELATEIYKRMRTVKDVPRKDIIEKFIAEVRLTKAGASTYYQLIKDKHEPMGRKWLDAVLPFLRRTAAYGTVTRIRASSRCMRFCGLDRQVLDFYYGRCVACLRKPVAQLRVAMCEFLRMQVSQAVADSAGASATQTP